MSARLPQALLISLGVTFGLTLVLGFIFGPSALGLFLFLPLYFAFGRSSSRKRSAPFDNQPIEPR